MRLILILTTLLTFQSAAASEFDETKALADQGNVYAQFALGFMYANGRGVPENDVSTDLKVMSPGNLPNGSCFKKG